MIQVKGLGKGLKNLLGGDLFHPLQDMVEVVLREPKKPDAEPLRGDSSQGGRPKRVRAKQILLRHLYLIRRHRCLLDGPQYLQRLTDQLAGGFSGRGRADSKARAFTTERKCAGYPVRQPQLIA